MHVFPKIQTQSVKLGAQTKNLGFSTNFSTHLTTHTQALNRWWGFYFQNISKLLTLPTSSSADTWSEPPSSLTQDVSKSLPTGLPVSTLPTLNQFSKEQLEWLKTLARVPCTTLHSRTRVLFFGQVRRARDTGV